MNLHGKNIIGRELSADGPEMRDQSGFAGSAEALLVFHSATENEVNRAVRLADASFAAYRSLTPERRAEFLNQIAEKILELGDELLEMTSRETGLPIARLTGERGRTVGQLRLFADLIREGSWVDARIDRALPNREPAPRPDLRRMLIALGPVGVFGASNFPYAFSVAGGDTASALAAGCPVIVKAHSAHPRTSEMTARAVLAAAEATDMPEGVFSMVYGRDAGITLVRHPLLYAVGFTGSREAGMRLFHEAANRPRPIPVYAEMSAVNPVFILPHALRERGEAIAAGLAQSATLGVGQFCTKPGLVFLQGETRDAFTRALAEKFALVAPARMLTEGIHNAYAKGIDRLRDTPGARLAGRSEQSADKGGWAEAAVFETDAATFSKTPTLSEEVFGPATLLIAADTPAELEEAARNLEGQLTATIHATPEDLRENRRLISILETKVGRLLYNGFPTGVEVVPAMQHGGPFPSTTDSRSTSVGTAAIVRFVRPLCYQNSPDDLLPAELQNANPRNIWRLVDNEWTRDAVTNESS